MATQRTLWRGGAQGNSSTVELERAQPNKFCTFLEETRTGLRLLILFRPCSIYSTPKATEGLLVVSAPPTSWEGKRKFTLAGMATIGAVGAILTGVLVNAMKMSSGAINRVDQRQPVFITSLLIQTIQMMLTSKI